MGAAVIALLPPLTSATLIGLGVIGWLSFITPITALSVVLILAPMRTLIATESPGMLPLEIGMLTLLFLCGVWGGYSIIVHKRLIHFTWTAVYVPVLAYLFVTGLTLFTAHSTGAWFTEWLKWVVVAVMIALVLEMGQGRRWEWIVFVLALAATANAIVGIYTFLGGSGALHLLINNRFFRAFGTFGQPNPFGGFMGLLAPVTLMMAYGYLLRLWHVFRQRGQMPVVLVVVVGFYGVASALIVLGMFCSWSRGAWLGLIVSMGSVLFALPKRLWQSLLGILLIAVLIVAIWSTGLLPASISERVSSATQELFTLSDVRAVDITPENYAVVERLAHWQAALRMAESSPWLGVGFGNYEVVYESYRLINWEESLGHAHNYYLNVLAETGMIGLAAYLAVFACILWLTWQTRRQPDDLSRCMAVGLIGTWVYLLAHSLTDNLYVNNIFIHLGVMLGILAVLHRQIARFTIVMMD